MSKASQINEAKVNIFSLGFMLKYSCIQDRCINDCCNSWTIEVDKATMQKWKEQAPELLESVEQNPYRPEAIRMKTLGEDRSCIQLQGGMCAVHKARGADMLPEICNYFPQLYKAFNGKIHLSGTPACPSVAYIILSEDEDNNFKIHQASSELKKAMNNISNYELKGASTQVISSVFAKIMAFVSGFSNVRLCLKSLYFASKLLDETDIAALPQSIDLILKLSNYSGKNIKINYNFEANIFDSIIELTLEVSTRTKPFISLILQKLKDIKAGEQNPLQIYQKYEAAKDGLVANKKYLRRFVKAKLGESIFPFTPFFTHEEDFILLYCEYLIVDFVIAVFWSQGALSERVIGDIIHSIAREFYAKKRSRLMDLIKAQNLDKIENLFALQ